MSRIVRCPQGHEWSQFEEADTTAADGPTICPVCGSTEVPKDEATLTVPSNSVVLVSQLDSTEELSTASFVNELGQSADKTEEMTVVIEHLQGDFEDDKTQDLSTASGQDLTDAALITLADAGRGELSDQTDILPGFADQTMNWKEEDEQVSAGTGEWTAEVDPVHFLAGADNADQEKTVDSGVDQSGKTAAAGSQVDRSTQPGQPHVEGYEILAELGRGAMGVVYKAKQTALNRLVALKMVLAGQHASQRELVRFQIEAEAVARLHHANIVQIYEIGEQEGRPYFSLEFVEGGTLSDKIVRHAVPPNIAARLVLQLAHAMDSAHRCGIVHRDLKPANILLGNVNLGPDGLPKRSAPDRAAVLNKMLATCVPKISDFGLAKRLEEDSGQTRAGSILGTPSYMAPEQAEGRTNEVGPSADIYALGAILYDLLTARPPFRGKTLLETLEQVKAREPVPPSRLTQKLPRDLETICLKCLQKEPSKRYGSAGDLAEDLRRFLEGEAILGRRTPAWERTWKWCKRRPALAGLIALTSASLISLIVGGALYAEQQTSRAKEETRLHEKAEEQRRIADEQRALAEAHEQTANEQRNLAEENFHQAQAAVDIMLTRIGQERLEHEPRLEQVRRDLLEEALHFYDRFLEQRSDDPGIHWQTGKAFKRAGEIRQMLGQQVEAEAAYDSAITILEGLKEENPDSKAYLQDLAATSNQLGNLLNELRRSEPAEKAFQRARAIQGQLVESDPQNAAYRQELATSDYNLGGLLQSQSQAKAAEPLFKEALALQQKLVDEFKDKPVYRRELANTYSNLASLKRSTGNQEDAAKLLGSSLDLLTELAERKDAIPADRQALAIARKNLGNLLEPTNAAQAEEEYRLALKLNKSLVEDFPTIPIYQQELAASHNNLGVLLHSKGQREEADKELQQGLALKQKLADNFPRKPDYRLDLAKSYNNYGILIQTNRRFPDSAAAYGKGLDLLEKLVQEFPGIPDYQQELALTLLNLATVLQASDKEVEAEKAYRRAKEEWERVLAQQSESSTCLFQSARTLYLLATLLQTHSQLDEAEKLHRSALAKFKPLAERNPQEPDFAFDLAGCLNNLGDLLRATNRPKEALDAWQEAEKALKELARSFPKRPIYAQEEAKTLHNQGVVLNQLGRFQDAEKAHNQAIAIRQQLVDDFPNEPVHKQKLARSHGELGIILASRNQLEKSEEAFRKAIELIDGLEKKYPDQAEYWQDELIFQDNLAQLTQALGHRDDAEKCQRRVKELKEKLAKAGSK